MSSILPGLPQELVLHVARFLSENEIICTGKLLNKAAARLFKSLTKLKLSAPVPQHAFAHHWGQAGNVLALKRERREELINLTVSSGVLANLQLVYTLAELHSLDDAVAMAARGGHLDVCRWLLSRGCRGVEVAVEAAVTAGHLSLARWLLPLRDHFRSHVHVQAKALAAAAQSGNRAFCEELLATGIPCSWDVVVAAARGGHVGLTQWLLHLPQLSLLRDEDSDSRLLEDAVFGFGLTDLQHLYCGLDSLRDEQTKRDLGSTLTEAALSSPHPDWEAKLDWLELQGFPLALTDDLKSICSLLDAIIQRPDAVQRIEFVRQRKLHSLQAPPSMSAMANLPVLRHLHAQGLVRWDKDSAAMAARQGDLALLQELVSMGCPVTAKAVLAALGQAHLHILQWIEQQPSFGTAIREVLQDDQAMIFALESGEMEMVKWMLDHGCDWHEDSWSEAAWSGSRELLEWLAAEGCPIGVNPYINTIMCAGDLATLRTLWCLGFPLPEHVTEMTLSINSNVTECGRLAVLQWLLDEGVEFDWQTAKDLLEALVENGMAEDGGPLASFIEQAST